MVRQESVHTMVTSDMQKAFVPGRCAGRSLKIHGTARLTWKRQEEKEEARDAKEKPDVGLEP